MKSEELSPNYHQCMELSLQDDCMLWDAHAPRRAGILQELHMTHPSMSSMKAEAFSYVY